MVKLYDVPKTSSVRHMYLPEKLFMYFIRSKASGEARCAHLKNNKFFYFHNMYQNNMYKNKKTYTFYETIT